ncbi:MAG: MBL fold metallo-hydrolase, partial [Pseudomonadales bacterium]|nr:MBL fold metallo-hydrolase [Pseudomonadales bacterium]
MAVKIPFTYRFDFEYGKMQQLSPRIRRVIANNPGAFSFTGTGTFIIGRGKVAMIDPGPLMEEHIEAILDGIKGEEVTHILITHTHMDHSPAARIIKERTGAKTYGYGPHGEGKREQGVKVEEGGDMDFIPDVKVTHGEIIKGHGWNLEAVY